MNPIHEISSYISANSKLILDVGKIVLALIMFMFSLFSLFIIFGFITLKQKLQAMELNALETREETVAVFAEAREGLKALRGSLAAQSEFDSHELLRHGGELVMLLLSAQRNPLAWGAVGLNVAKGAMRYFFSRR